MKVILINSFNSAKYATASIDLATQINNIGYTTIIVYGGACLFTCSELIRNFWCISIPENLSDNNAFVGFERAFKMGFFRENCFREATYILIHDTCKISPNFQQRLNDLPAVNGWVFAHSYGLYNIGICDQRFLLTRARDFEQITFLPKDKSIALEQGVTVNADGVDIPPLLKYSSRTLSKYMEPSMENCDSMSLNAFGASDDSRRYVSYLGSLGIFKFVGSKVTYFIPIWATNAHEVKTNQDFEKMKRSFSHISLSTSEQPIGTINPWIHLVPL